LEIIKCYQQVNKANIKSSLIIKDIYSAYGIRGFYIGLIPNVVKEIHSLGLTLAVCTIAKDYISHPLLYGTIGKRIHS